MKRSIAVTVLVENASDRTDLGSEHGLAYWIEWGDRRVMFDTGQSDLVMRNARVLGIDVSRAEAIVLSHGHYDHTGGLGAVLGEAREAKVFIHRAGLEAKYSRHGDGSRHAVGMPQSSRDALARHVGEQTLMEGPTEIVKGLHATGAVPRETGYEDTGGAFYLDEACTREDPLLDDQALYFSCSEGTVVVLGCAHAGVVNTLEYVQRLTEGEPIFAVVGGMHLHSASAGRLKATVEAIRELKVQLIAPAHCTGLGATTLLREEFLGQFAACHAGSRFVFEEVMTGTTEPDAGT